MKRIYFRILAICLSLVLTFSILYKDSMQAEALEWVGVAVGYDTAFKFLLGLLGVSVGVGVAENVDWGTLRQNAVQVQLDQGNSQAEVSAWWSNIIHGSIDTASDCWDSFKDYVSSLTSSGSDLIPSSDILNIIKGIRPAVVSVNGIPDNLSFKIAIYRVVQGGQFQFLFFDDTSSVSIVNDYIYIYGNYYGTGTLFDSYNNLNFSYSTNSGIELNRRYENYYVWGLDSSYDSFFEDSTKLYKLHRWDIASLGASDFEALYPNIGDIALNPENADTLATDVIPLPWENIGASDTDIESIIDDAISRVIDGTMSLENYWEYVQNITNTYAYSIENNYLLPNENGEDKKADDKVKENAENGAFVLYGLEKVFPFCIPFDIYAFITLLKADPVAPVIEYPIYNPVTQENEIITIDFSEWESVVIIFRYIFDFLLIIGLLLLARPLVGAGGDS